MDKLMDKMQSVLMPLAQKLNSNRYLAAIRDAFIAITSILIVGSFFTLFGNLPIKGYSAFMAEHLGKNWQLIFSIPADATINVMTIYVVIVISAEMAKYYKLDRYSASFMGLISFLTLTPMPVIGKSGAIYLPMNNLGTNGLFLGMICAFASVGILHFTTKHNWQIKMPDSVPSNIATTFSALIPIAIDLIIFDAIRIIFSFTSFHYAQNFIFGILQKPITALGATLPAVLLAMIIESLLWFFGINGGSIVGNTLMPIYLAMLSENAKALAKGTVLPNWMNYETYCVFIKVAGSGTTIGLAILLLFFSKSEQFKSIGKLSIIPNIFTINEPVIFGVPIVLNPIMFIPFVLVPIVLTILTYIVMHLGLVPYCNGVVLPWTTPPILSGFLVSGWQGAIYNAIEIILSMLMYFPFFKMADQEALTKEKKMAQAE